MGTHAWQRGLRMAYDRGLADRIRAAALDRWIGVALEYNDAVTGAGRKRPNRTNGT